MKPFSTPADLMRLSMQTGFMLMQAQMVIGMRMMGMWGLWNVHRSETARMSSEKVSALAEAALASSRAALSGKPPALIAEAALKPIHRRTASNVKRLVRRGPGKP